MTNEWMGRDRQEPLAKRCASGRANGGGRLEKGGGEEAVKTDEMLCTI